MFEPSLYEPERVATPPEDGDLFYDYEIKTWELSPRVYKILGVSAVANILAFVVMAQTSMLTMKGCDSPLVSQFCQALDMVYVGTQMFGTERDYVDAVYDRTELGDSEVTFVDVSGVIPPMSYPEGYFQIANPEQYQARLDALNNPDLMGFPQGVPISPVNPGGSLFDTKPYIPPANPDVIDGELPTFGNSGNDTKPPVVARRNPRGPRTTTPRRNNNRAVPNDNTVADIDDNSVDDLGAEKPIPTPLSSQAVTGLEINRKPLTDFADIVSTKWAANEVDLNREFMIVLDGVITKEGKLDREKSKFDTTKQQGDEGMINIAKAAIEAVGDSGFLTYLQSLGVEKVNLVLVQDKDQVNATITSAQRSAERAQSVSSGLNGYITLGKISVKNPSDERTLLDGAKVTAEGRNFILNFVIPKPIAQEMITRKLREAQAQKASQPQPNSSSDTKESDNLGQ